MIFVRFGRWSNAADRFFTWKRIYLRGWRWTPFVRVNIRKYHKPTASEALYSFGAWLTSRSQPITISDEHDARVVAELIGEFCKANQLADPRDGWTAGVVWPREAT